jgi:Icc-related predicted phosphoesterase
MSAGPVAHAPLSRRAMCRLLAVGAGAWWGREAALGAQPQSFRFLVVNDLHHASPDDDGFFRSLVAQMASHGDVDFCLIVGDIADTGRPESFAAVREVFADLRAPIYTVPGNHDNDVEKSTRLYAEAFPGRLNYTFTHKDWQFIGLDSTEAEKWTDTRISDAALAWLDATLPSLDRARPLVLFTHFPLAAGVNLRPLNADDVLARFDGFNLRGSFGGHYHARIERRLGDTPLVINACCSRARDNHDGSVEEGYLLCTAEPNGRLSWEFVEFVAARKAAAATTGQARRAASTSTR